MKKTNFLLVVSTIIALVGTALFTTGCSKSAVNEDGFCLDGKSAVEVARKENKNILIIATREGDDLFSSDLLNIVLKDSRFNEEIGKDYTVLCMDFSQKSYEATVYNEESTKKEIKIAEENAERMQLNTLLASRLNLQLTPAIYVMSKDMYFISQLDFLTDQITKYDDFKELIDSQKQIVDDFNNKINLIENNKGQDKLVVIDELYESTDIYYRTFLLDLIKEYIETDKNNESGLLSKYLLAKADIESSNYFMAGDVNNAVKAYVDVAEDTRLSPEHRQNSYYLAAYILTMTQSTDYETIRNYLKKAIEAYPDGPNAVTIQAVIDQFTSIIESASEENVNSEVTE